MHVPERVKELLEPIAKERNYFVLDVEFRRRGPEKFLSVTLDKPGGITLEECASVNTELGDMLEKENLITEHYVLEVTSPGLDRRLKSDNDFTWAVGKKLKVTTYKPFDGKNVFKGKLIGMTKETIVVDEDGTSTEIPRDMIAKAKLEPEIEWDKG